MKTMSIVLIALYAFFLIGLMALNPIIIFPLSDLFQINDDDSFNDFVHVIRAMIAFNTLAVTLYMYFVFQLQILKAFAVNSQYLGPRFFLVLHGFFSVMLIGTLLSSFVSRTLFNGLVATFPLLMAVYDWFHSF